MPAYPSLLPFTGERLSYDNRLVTPLHGRHLLITNSATVEYLDVQKRFVYPLPTVFGVGGYDPGNGQVQAFIIEAHGYLLTEPGSFFNIVETDPYERFRFHILGDPYSLIKPFVPTLPPPPPPNIVTQATMLGPFPGSALGSSTYGFQVSTLQPNALTDDRAKRWFYTDGPLDGYPPDPTGLLVTDFLNTYTSYYPS